MHVVNHLSQKQSKAIEKVDDNNDDDDDNEEEEEEEGSSSLGLCFSHIGFATKFSCIALFGLLLRLAVSLHPYSGYDDPPKYGDYEAQRHWMEITVNLPVKQWYHNSTENDLSYWGLDYPPLTAYQSYVHGLLLGSFDADSVSLYASRGHESSFGKLLMRWTVLLSDILVFFPAVMYFVLVYHKHCFDPHNNVDVAWHITVILINPCLILIDHGHFQYNCISLGLTLGAVAAVLSDKDLIACFLFSLSLNHKQMSAYFAPAFFSHLLGKSIRSKHPLLKVMKLGLVVLGTFAIVWWPYLQSKETFLEVARRLVPFERGIYEDYVANFWCATSMLVKWKRLLGMESMKLLSFIATLLTCLPSMIQQISTPSNRGFLYALLNSSLSFYLFSFQVHEKSILLPLLPATLLAKELPYFFELGMHYALFSLLPLLCRDHLMVSYLAIYALFILLIPCRSLGATKVPSFLFSLTLLMAFLYVCSILLHVAYLTIIPPHKYPFLFEACIMLLCFLHFLLFALFSNVRQLMMFPKYSSSLYCKNKLH